jgi:hypothetical protein
VRDDLFLPKELVQKCFALIESSHKRHGFGNLPGRITAEKSMVPLALFPDGLALMGSTAVAFKLRILNWVVGLAILIAGSLLNHWILLGLVVTLAVDRKLASFERRQWTLLAAFLLALEVLANNFAGWGDAYPAESQKALKMFSDDGQTIWLDLYLPPRNELDSSLRWFGPHSA